VVSTNSETSFAANGVCIGNEFSRSSQEGDAGQERSRCTGNVARRAKEEKHDFNIP